MDDADVQAMIEDSFVQVAQFDAFRREHDKAAVESKGDSKLQPQIGSAKPASQAPAAAAAAKGTSQSIPESKKAAAAPPFVAPSSSAVTPAVALDAASASVGMSYDALMAQHYASTISLLHGDVAEMCGMNAEPGHKDQDALYRSAIASSKLQSDAAASFVVEIKTVPGPFKTDDAGIVWPVSPSSTSSHLEQSAVELGKYEELLTRVAHVLQKSWSAKFEKRFGVSRLYFIKSDHAYLSAVDLFTWRIVLMDDHENDDKTRILTCSDCSLAGISAALDVFFTCKSACLHLVYKAYVAPQGVDQILRSAVKKKLPDWTFKSVDFYDNKETEFVASFRGRGIIADIGYHGDHDWRLRLDCARSRADVDGVEKPLWNWNACYTSMDALLHAIPKVLSASGMS
jgi:hypothetical protein